MEVNVIVEIFQGVVNSVNVFSTEEKALAWLSDSVDESIKTVDDFAKWQEENKDDDFEYHWVTEEVQ